MRTTSVMAPLHSERFTRTRRSSAPSAAVTSGSAFSTVGETTPSAIRQPIPDAADGLDEPARRSELGPQVMHVCIDGARCDRDAKRPGLVQQLIARQCLARVPEETLEERELARAEVDETIIHRHATSRFVEHDRADAQPWLGTPSGRRRTAPGKRPKAGRQLLVRKRLHEVVVRARVEAGHPVTDSVPCGEHEDRHTRTTGPEAT